MFDRGINRKVVRILSIDGGGIRGIFPATVLEKIEENLPSQRLIADYFDVLGGTSTGGIITLGLTLKTVTQDTKYHYTANQILKFYTTEANKIFPGSGYGPGIKSAQYEASGIESFLKEKFGESLFMNDIIKKLMVCSYDLNDNKPFYIRSGGWYENKNSPENMKIWEAARATSAAPTYFPAINVIGKTLIDGGIYINNPALQLLLQAREAYPNAEKFILVSLGTGKAKYNYQSCKKSGAYGWLLSGEGNVLDGKGALLNSMMLGTSNAIHNQIVLIENSKLIPVVYYRLNPPLTKEIPLDGKTSTEIGGLEDMAENFCAAASSVIKDISNRIINPHDD